MAPLSARALTSTRSRRVLRTCKAAVRRLSRAPMASRYARWSAIAPIEPGAANDRLLDLALNAAAEARRTNLAGVAARAGTSDEQAWVQQWPGEHYRLLAGLARVMDCRLAVEVGTYTGLGSLSLLAGMGDGGRVVTYDVVPWAQIPSSALADADFHGSLEQRLGDLSDPSYFASQAPLLRQADLVFVDAPKDGRFEPAFLGLLLPCLRGHGTTLVVDDIRLIEMVGLWESLPVPKLDVTSLGHWSGTGLAQVP